MENTPSYAFKSASKQPEARGSLTNQQDYASASSWKTECMELNGQPGMELTQEPLKCDEREVAKSGQQLGQLLMQLPTPKPPRPHPLCLHS